MCNYIDNQGIYPKFYTEYGSPTCISNFSYVRARYLYAVAVSIATQWVSLSSMIKEYDIMTMIDTISGYFLCLLAHLVLISVLFFNQEPFLLASYPLCVEEVGKDSQVEFIVLLSLLMFFNVSELVLLLARIPPVEVSLFSSLSHAISCLFLLKFIIDSHPMSSFWILLMLTSFPPLMVNVVISIISSRVNKP